MALSGLVTLASESAKFQWLHMELDLLVRVTQNQGKAVELVREGTSVVMRISLSGIVTVLKTLGAHILTLG